MTKIRKNLVSSSIAKKVTYGGTNTKQYIVIHETANTSKGANADAHGRLQANGNSRSASWHYTVDDKEIVQSFSDNAQCWHAGNASYNRNSIGIEICVNSDGNYKKAVDNAIELTKHLMKKYNISASNVIQHNTASGKDCPRYLRAGNKGITWSQFKSKLTNTSSNSNTSTSKPVKRSQAKGKANYNTKSIVTFLQSINQPFSLNHRKKLAKIYGVKNYKGQASLNLQLLDLIKKDYKTNDKLKTKATTSKSKTTKKSATALKVGNKVKIKSSAKKYSRSTSSIPSKHKNKIYTIQQVAKNDVLIKELYSWIKKSDLVGGASTSKPKGKSVSQMATEVISGKHGNGHTARRKSLGISQSEYNKVRAEVNRRL